MPGCNRTYEGAYGRIFSPRWPRNVARNSYCQFIVRAPEGKKISVYFGAFGIRSSANCTQGALEV